MERKKPVHLKKKIADTAHQLTEKAQEAALTTQIGLEEFGEEIAFNAALAAEKIESAKDQLMGGIRQKVTRQHSEQEDEA